MDDVSPQLYVSPLQIIFSTNLCFTLNSLVIFQILFHYWCLLSIFLKMLKLLIILMKLVAVCETKFHYQDKIPPIDYVVKIASSMEVFFFSFSFLLLYTVLPLEFVYVSLVWHTSYKYSKCYSGANFAENCSYKRVVGKSLETAAFLLDYTLQILKINTIFHLLSSVLRVGGVIILWGGVLWT